MAAEGDNGAGGMVTMYFLWRGRSIEALLAPKKGLLK